MALRLADTDGAAGAWGTGERVWCQRGTGVFFRSRKQKRSWCEIPPPPQEALPALTLYLRPACENLLEAGSGCTALRFRRPKLTDMEQQQQVTAQEGCG